MKRNTQAETWQCILDAMPGTRHQLAERVGVTKQCIDRAMIELVPMRAHVSEWDLTGRLRWEATYTSGRGANKAKPAPVGLQANKADAIKPPRVPARYDDKGLPRAFFGGVR